MKVRVIYLIGFILFVVSQNTKALNVVRVSESSGTEQSVGLNYTNNQDTTIRVRFERSGSLMEKLTINLYVNNLLLTNEINEAKATLYKNTYKYAALLPVTYYISPMTVTFQVGVSSVNLDVIVKKWLLLKTWEGSTENYILPLSIQESTNYDINENYRTTQLIFRRLTPPGNVIKYMPASGRVYVGSPSICVLPSGDYVAAYDDNYVDDNSKNKTTHIYRSTDKGETWQYASTIDGQFWSTLFLNNGCLFIIGVDKVAGNMIIRLSTDDGFSWTTPTSKLNGLLFSGRYHTAPTPVVIHNGRIWKSIEDAELSGQNEPGKILYRAMVISAPINCDILNGYNWEASNGLDYDSTYLNNNFGGWLEGNSVVDKNGNMCNIIRVDVPAGVPEYVGIQPIVSGGKKISFDAASGFLRMTGGSKKFTIRYDEISKTYYTLVNFDYGGYDTLKPTIIRNCLIMMSSDNLSDWKINKILLRHSDLVKVGFQYVDWQFEGDDIVFVTRTSYNDIYSGAMNFHNANYLTFHRIINFRNLKNINLDRNSI